MKVLIVDDAKFLRETLKDILKKHSIEVVAEGENGIEAVQLYKQLQPDVLITDITMPKMNGIEAITKIKQEFPDAKIIICSAMGQQKMVIEAIEAGALDFITKPFDEDRVMEAIKRVMN
ncbi:response regulator [Aeribacillus sp. FSL M8-0254]|uniref:response regulator n=1 Tax=Aeribacillus sp. FSL M8-0254 TaxID=2954577 RepID=UPI0030FA227E